MLVVAGTIAAVILSELDEEPALIELHLWRMNLMHDWLSACLARHEQCGLIFFLDLCGVHFLILLLFLHLQAQCPCFR
jgi:hypothetical protein